MSRDIILSVLASFLLHGSLAGGGYLFKKRPGVASVEAEAPTIELNLPPPPEPEEPEPVENLAAEAPADAVDLAPPMQNDTPSAVIDSPFVQKLQAPPPPGINRSAGAIAIPTDTRPSAVAGPKMANLFNLGDLDQKPEARVRTSPIYPFEMRRSALKGYVMVGFIVDSGGDVRDPYIVRSSNPGFEQAAMDTVLKWKFKPGKKGGVAVNTRVQQPIEFGLNEQ